jgi:hypothetical protein
VPLPTDQRSESKEGIFVYDPRTQAVSLFPSLTHIVDYAVLGAGIEPEKYGVLFSPSFDQAILFYNPQYSAGSPPLTSQFDASYPSPTDFDSAFLISLNELNTSPLDVTNSALSLVEAWSLQKSTNLTALLAGYHRKIQDFIASSTKIVDISPDKTRILYEATAAATLKPILEQPLIGANQTPNVRTTQSGSLYVYDAREDKNYLMLPSAELTLQHAYPLFHPNSKNIILDEANSISVMDYDGMNRQKLYSGPYDPTFFVVTSDGRVLVLTNFNSTLTKTYDLYAIGIK